MCSSRLRSSFLFALLGVAACGGSGGPDAPAIPEERAHEVALAIAENVIVPAIAEFETAAAALEAASATYAGDPTNADALAAARGAFIDAMAAWQRLEVMQVGPAGAAGTVLGGQGIRAEIYAWPQTNLCAINQQTALGAYADVDAFAATAVNVRGLGAVEYLLFDEAYAHECTSGAPAPWPPVDQADLVARRAAYVSTLAILVHRQANALSDAWDPAVGNFLGQIDAAGDATSVYPTANAALNAISDAMFYVDLETKDLKVAVPINLDGVACAFAVCADAVESPYADLSIDDIRENLVGFRALFIGGAPGSANLGFDDLLVDVNQPALADTMLAEIDQAVATCDGFAVPLEEALVTDLPSVQTLYAEIKNVTDLLKTQFAALLDLEVPAAAAGDND